MRISDWSSDVCSSDLLEIYAAHRRVRRSAAPCAGGGVRRRGSGGGASLRPNRRRPKPDRGDDARGPARGDDGTARRGHDGQRSEEHTSELQSLMRISYAVFCLKKKKT